MKRPRKPRRTLAQLRAELERLRRRVELDPRVIAAQDYARRIVIKARAQVRAEHDHEFSVVQAMISRRERGTQRSK